jgi:FKBP-type peptidyl-prolyl cis-trans isomerase 2
MTVIAKDRYVVLEYRMRLDSGELIRGSAEAPVYLQFVAGYG